MSSMVALHRPASPPCLTDRNRIATECASIRGMESFPEGSETERLLVRAPRPGDGPEMHAAVSESLDEFLPWVEWPKEHGTAEDSG